MYYTYNKSTCYISIYIYISNVYIYIYIYIYNLHIYIYNLHIYIYIYHLVASFHHSSHLAAPKLSISSVQSARSFTESSTLSAKQGPGREGQVLAETTDESPWVQRMSQLSPEVLHFSGLILSGHDMWRWTILLQLSHRWNNRGFPVPAEGILESQPALCQALPEASFHDTELAGRTDDGSMDLIVQTWSAGQIQCVKR